MVGGGGGWWVVGGGWWVGGGWSRLLTFMFTYTLDATLTRSSLALANYLDATLTRSSLALVTRPKGQPCVRTGGIDCTWKKIKDQIPPSIHTRKKGNINKDLMAYMRQCQGTAETAC